MTHIAIIGGGLTGLTTAYRLVQAGVKVTIFEGSDRLGGLAAGCDLAGHHVEQAYHFLYKTDEYILALAEELGFRDKLTYHKSSVSTYYGNKLYPMETPLDLIRFTPLSFVNRIRAGLSVLYLQKVKDWRPLSKTTALDWLRRNAGKQVTDVIWEPLLRGKFDRYYDKITMSWLWGRVLQRVDSRDKDLGGEALGYFEGGFRVVIDSLVNPVRAAGADIRLNARVKGLRYKDRATGTEAHVPLEGVFVQIGLVPNTEWLKDSGLELSKHGEIVIDSHAATNLPGVFAAGDVTTVPYKQIIIAMGEGSKAALSAFDYLIRNEAVEEIAQAYQTA